MPLTLRPYQKEAVDAAIDYIFNDTGNQLLWVPTAGGKAQPLHSKVLTPNGWTEMGNIHVGDKISTPSGGEANVVGVYPQGEKDIYKITLADGREVLSCKEHLWKMHCHDFSKNCDKWRVKELSWILERKGKRHIYFPTAEVEMPEEEHKIHPYVIGALLGDGGLSQAKTQIMMSSADHEIVERMNSFIKEGIHFKKSAWSKYGYTLVLKKRRNDSNPALKEFRKEIIDLGINTTSYFKHIPDQYKRGTKEQRLELIRGLADTDGYVSTSQQDLSISTVSKRMANDIREVVWSLGGTATINAKKTPSDFGVCYNVHINHPMRTEFVTVPRKKSLIKKPQRQENKVRVLSVELHSTEEAQCIAIDSDDHLYVTDNYVVTHNTIIQAEIAKRIYDIAPQHQILCITDVTALIKQNRDELLEQWAHAKTSIYSASYNQKDHSGEIVFAGIQSVYKHAHLFKNVSVVFVDEQHRASLEEGSMYHKFWTKIKEMNPTARMIGLTGSPWKMDGPLEGTWLCDKITYEIKMETLFKEGFLCPIVPPPEKLSATADLSGVKINRKGEFDEHEMQIAMDDNYLTKCAINDAMKYSKGRSSCLIFASGVEHAYHVKEEFASRGERAEVITGDTKKEERERIVKDFREFRLKWLISIGTLTTGFNAKNADMAIILRATQSSSLWLQIVGRLLRTHESKNDALLLDYGQNVERFGRIDRIIPPPSKEEKAKARKQPFKECWNCGALVPTLDKWCGSCDVEFKTERSPNHGTEASKNSVVEDFRQIDDREVVSIDFQNYSARTKGRQGNKSVRISYFMSDGDVIHEYFDFETGEAWKRRKACDWWYMFSSDEVVDNCPTYNQVAIGELKAYGIKKPAKLRIDYSKVIEKNGNRYGHKILEYIM